MPGKCPANSADMGRQRASHGVNAPLQRTPLYSAMHGGELPDDVLTMIAIEDALERTGLTFEAIQATQDRMTRGVHYTRAST